MSFATSIISGLELIGMASGGYIGYKYGNRVKTECCKKYPIVEKYRKDYVADKFKKSQISEETMFNMIGSLVGVFGGYKVWFVVIPLLAYQVTEEYPEEYKKFKKFISDSKK